ncbi:hypothetical protein LCGC14_1969270 [marine sediment metagenome]|uniref:Uncharacterized protein n=1 Tax=marine sediment metagenome TaxID=412755 RepID=A0A0F9FC88_9ZZZZ
MVQTDIRQILARRPHKLRTLCQVIREIHDMGMDMGNCEVTNRCEEALIKAKKMDARLKAYKKAVAEHGITV